MAIARPFGYEGKPGTCLWCGRRFRERYAEITIYERQRGEVVPAVGDTFRGRVVKRVVKRVETLQATRPDLETPGWRACNLDTRTKYKVYFENPTYDAYFTTEPMFDTMTCGLHFGLRMAQLGKRLESTDNGDST